MMFSWQIDLGSILNAVSLCIVAFAGAKKLGVLEFKLNLLWANFKSEKGVSE